MFNLNSTEDTTTQIDERADKGSAYKRIVTVSNRLPIVVTTGADGRRRLERGSGGLVSAIAPVLRDRGGLWLGWSGGVKDKDGYDLHSLLAEVSRQWGYDLHAVSLDSDEVEKYYYGFANEIVWPIFHDLQSLCNFNPEYWKVYRQVNRKFAECTADCHQAQDYIWVHDYHLMRLGRELRKLRIDSLIGFYLHIPFPPLDIFLKLPWRLEMLRDLFYYDLIGFQTFRDRRNFIECVEHIVPFASVEEENEQVSSIHIEKWTVRTGSFPIGIDFRAVEKEASSVHASERASRIGCELSNQKVILGVDRLDYTKGIPYRLDAFRDALHRYPDLRGKITLVQVVAPSRRRILQYSQLQSEIERLVGEINGHFTQPGWVPIQYIFRNLDHSEVIAYYRCADVALITPLKDGMNLVAKEYCASKVDGNGVLVLSEFAGAATQLQEGALLVNPYHIELVADVIHQAVNMPEEDARRRMRKLRQAVRDEDIFWWVDSFLGAAFRERLTHFPALREYLPQLKI